MREVFGVVVIVHISTGVGLHRCLHLSNTPEGTFETISFTGYEFHFYIYIDIDLWIYIDIQERHTSHGPSCFIDTLTASVPDVSPSVSIYAYLYLYPSVCRYRSIYYI